MTDKTTITPTNNGPYHIVGSFKIVTSGGREIEVDGNETWLCRCGFSNDKPFCDGTHHKIKFQSDLDAVVEQLDDFLDVASVDEIEEGELKGVRVGTQPVVLGKVDGEIYAIGGICSHQAASLADGELDGETVICPLHNSGFNIKTGRATQLPAELPVPTYEVKITDGRVLVATTPRQTVP